MKQKASAINIIWGSLVLMATVTAAYTGKMDDVTRASFESAKSAVMLAIGLIGPMALWLGIMKVAEAGGLLQIIAGWMRAPMERLFPEVPPDHPAMAAMIMNMAANALGLGNAATPMGIKAMLELNTLSAEKGTATNAMCLFLAINTSNVTLLPLGVITVRAAANASNPASILLPTLFATLCSTIVAIIAAKMLARPDITLASGPARAPGPKEELAQEEGDALILPGLTGKIFILLLIVAFAGGIVYRILQAPGDLSFSTNTLNAASSWLIPVLISTFLVFGYLRGVKLYETLTEGAKEGFTTAVRIIPYMVAIFVAIGMFRASGAMDIMIRIFSPATELIGMPAEALAMALMRPLSGSGAFGIMSEIVAKAPNSFLSFLVSTMQGSTETTFYVLAVYFGAVGIRRTRHALPAALLADATGIFASVFICNLLF
jgi:spore maturation protein SpmA